MSYAMDSARRIGCSIIAISWNRIGPKSEELAASSPMKGRRTRRVCTLGMLLLVQRGSSQSSAGRRWLSAGGPFCSHAVLLKPLNRGTQPVAKDVFDLALFAVPIQRVQRFTRFIEWNVATGDLGRAEFRRN